MGFSRGKGNSGAGREICKLPSLSSRVMGCERSWWIRACAHFCARALRMDSFSLGVVVVEGRGLGSWMSRLPRSKV